MVKKIIILSLVFVAGGVAAGLSGASAPQAQTVEQVKMVQWALPEKFVNTAVTKNSPFKPEFLLVKPLATDKPVVHPLLDLFQYAKDFEDMFSKNGKSMLCAPSSLANVLIYLKYNHNPAFGKIGEKHEKQIKTNGDWVDCLFKLCKTDKDMGTYAYDMEDAAKQLVAEGGYGVDDVFVKGYWSSIKKQEMAITPSILRAFCCNVDRGVVVQFGWYSVADENNKKIYKRNGGHCVALSGYDALDPNVFYVSNPLVDYSKVYPLRYSKVTMKKLPADIEAPKFTEWYTKDLVGGNFAVLELILVVLPQSRFSAPKIAK